MSQGLDMTLNALADISDTIEPQGVVVHDVLPLHDCGDWLSEANAEPVLEPVLDGVLYRGSKGLIVGPTKGKKSFFISQVAQCMALGLSFLHWSVSRQFRVLIFQPEIPGFIYRNRISVQAKGLGVAAAALKGKLFVCNARGRRPFDDLISGAILKTVQDKGIEVLCIDPLYKMLPYGIETAEDFRPVLEAFDQIVAETGATILTAHHTPKGQSGDRQVLDRAAGHGSLTRDADAIITLTPHRTEGLTVVHPTARCFAPTPAFSVSFNEKTLLFEASTATAAVRTSADFRQRSAAAAPVADSQILGLFASGGLAKADVLSKLAGLGLSAQAAQGRLSKLKAAGSLVFRRAGFQGGYHWELPGAAAGDAREVPAGSPVANL